MVKGWDFGLNTNISKAQEKQGFSEYYMAKLHKLETHGNEEVQYMLIYANENTHIQTSCCFLLNKYFIQKC